MARWHVKVKPSDDTAVPGELKDHRATVWRDPVAFRRWCGSRLREPPSPRHLDQLAEGAPGGRWRTAVDRWAVENRFSRQDWPKLPDWQRLQAAGVPSPATLPRPHIVAAPVEVF